jgi:ABC-2 type transport system ATP-binding protein
MRDIYLLIEDQREGPSTEDEVRLSLARGEIRGSTLAWRDGLADWVTVDQMIGALPPLPKTTAVAAAKPSPARAFGPALVQVDGVTKTFGDKLALKDITFAVPTGQICGLLGPNGAGKTTLFRLIMGILKATEGTLLVDGLDVFEKRVEAKRLIGFLPDEPIFYSYLSGREILELSAAMHGLDVQATMDRVAPLIAKMRLNEDIGNYAEDYSRGMKKKLGLLLALLHEPKLLILDEPTNGLDVESTHLFYDLILEKSEEGTTVLFSTHLMDHVTKLCSHAIIINGGTVVAKGSLEDLRAASGPAATLEDIFLKLTSRPVAQHQPGGGSSLLVPRAKSGPA